MWYIVVFTIGLCLGTILVNMFFHKKVNGVIRIDKSIPEDGPLFFLELKDNPKTLEQVKYVTLEVKVENYISQ